MTSEYIDIKGKWGIVLNYDLKPLDEYEMRAMMMSFGLRGRELDEAVDVLLHEKDSGMCISNDGLRMSLIFIGNATSEDQWWDTLAHELLDHCQRAIIEYYDVDYISEDSAWLTGYLMRKAVQKVGTPCV